MDWNLTYTKKNGKDYYNYENGAGKKIVGHSKLKLWVPSVTSLGKKFEN